MTDATPHDSPARDVRGLQRWISEWADATSETQARIQRRIALIAVSAMLANATADDGEPAFVVKGGSALELRYGSDARASRDIDVEYRGRLEEIHAAVASCIETGWSGFGGSVLDPQPLSIPWASVAGQRLSARLTYLGRPFSGVPLEIITRQSPAIDYVPSLRLDPVGIPAPDPVPCLSLPYQVAEKIHACTDPLDGERSNDRVSDLMDLVLIEDLSPDLDLLQTRNACVAVFEERGTHPWPPVVATSTRAERLWTKLVEDTDFTVAGLAEAADRVNAMISAIDRGAG